MSQFYVGQRVRVKWVGVKDAEHLLGAEGSITASSLLAGHEAWTTSFPTDRSGEYWKCKKTSAGKVFEPILLSCLEPADESVEELLPFLKGVSA